MKKLINEFFYIPANGKIREKAFLGRISLSVAIILLSLAAMGFSAYACFTSSILLPDNIIVASNYDLGMQVTNMQTKSVTVMTGDRIVGEAGTEYMVTLSYPTNSKTTASTGFCVVATFEGKDTNAPCTAIYHTQQIGVDKNVVDGGRRDVFSFYIKFNQEGSVQLTPYWGTSAYYNTDETELYVVENETVEVGTVTQNEPTDTTPESTTPSDGTSEETQPDSSTETTTQSDANTVTGPVSDEAYMDTPSTSETQTPDTSTDTTVDTTPETEITTETTTTDANVTDTPTADDTAADTTSVDTEQEDATNSDVTTSETDITPSDTVTPTDETPVTE